MQPYHRLARPLTPNVKKLIIITSGIFILQLMVNLVDPEVLAAQFGLHHIGFTHQLKLWQLLTYMFLHGSFFHIFFNMFALWMFGSDLEELFGSRNFLRFYIYSGIGAGIGIALMNYFNYASHEFNPITIGASGAVYAVLLAYGLIWPNRVVYLYFLFPIKMKYLLIFLGAIEFFGTIATTQGGGGNISHIGHLGGLVAGFVLLKTKFWYQKKALHNPFASLAKKFRLAKHKKRIDDRIKAKQTIDTLLDKITRSGYNSLTPDEKKQLEWARKHFYPDGNDIIH